MRTYVFLLLAIVLHLGLKNHAYWTATGFEPGRTTFFWTESAMHEYLTERVARGETLNGLDRRAQSPGGLDLRRDFTLGMPLAWGTLYRWLGPSLPPDVFVAFAQILVAALTVLGVFGLARAIFQSDGAALLSALFYAVSTASVARSVGAYLHEDFAHPLVVGGMASFLVGLPRARIAFAVASALLLAAALASWHFSQFLLLAFALGLVVADRLGRGLPARYLVWFTVILIAGAAAEPGLRAQGVWVSPALAVLIGLAVHRSCVPKLGGRNSFALATVAFLSALATYAWLGYGQQSHVFGLMIEKVRHGFVKPLDPLALSFEARSVWIEDDNTPNAFSFLYFTSFFIPLALLSALKTQRARWNTGLIVTTVMATVGLAMFVVAQRMVTTEIIWLSTLLGGAVLWITPRARIAAVAACLALMSLEFAKTWTINRGGYVQRTIERVFDSGAAAPLSRFGDQTDLIAWVRTQTSVDDAILAPIGLSPVILAQTHRPIVLHSKWESKPLRLKFEDFLVSLFSAEADFARFVRSVAAVYFVHDATSVVRSGPESARYMVGKTEVPADSAAYLFNYRPERLAHFGLVFENSTYRVFKLGLPGSPSPTPPLLFDEAVARSATPERLAERLASERARMRRAIELCQVDPAQAEDILLGLKREGARAWELEAYLCYTRLAIEDAKGAEAHCRKELEVRPHSVIGRFHSGLLAEVRGDSADAARWYRATLEADPRFGPARERLKE